MISKIFAFGNWIAFNKPLAKAFGCPTTSIVLSLLAEKSEQESDENGWFAYPKKQANEDAAIGRRLFEKAIKTLTEHGIIETKKRGMPATIWYRFKDDAFSKIQALISPDSSLYKTTNKFVQNDKQVCTFVQTYHYNKNNKKREEAKKTEQKAKEVLKQHKCNSNRLVRLVASSPLFEQLSEKKQALAIEWLAWREKELKKPVKTLRGLNSALKLFMQNDYQTCKSALSIVRENEWVGLKWGIEQAKKQSKHQKCAVGGWIE